MATPAELPGLSSEHEFFAPIDENFERDMEAIFANATRGQIESPAIWPMGAYHRLDYYQARSGVPELPMNQALNNPNGPWGGIRGSVQWRPQRRGLRGVGQDIVQVPEDQFSEFGAEVTPVPYYDMPLGQADDSMNGVKAVAAIAFSLGLLYVGLTVLSKSADAMGY
jgi:hypothetical protein